jgi:N6-adenosine-specific RNA methylase IME4
VTQLVKYEAARTALEAASTVDEAKDIRDKATAIQAYARQAKDSDLEIWASEIKLRAERRAGEMLKETELSKGSPGNQYTGKLDRSEQSTGSTLKDLDITPQQSSDWQKVADVDDDEFEAVLAGAAAKKKPANTAKVVQAAKKKENRKANAALKKTNSALPQIDRKYHCIIIDSPWPMKKIDRAERKNQTDFDYPTMTEAELAAFKIPAADDCHLFVWTTQKYLPMALGLLKPWGFKYVLTFVWHKPGGMQPFGLPQYNCEFAVYARKGAPQFIETTSFNTCFDAARREHSRKPDEFYDVVTRVCDGPRIDIFSREPRVGFDQYGNETLKFNGGD